ncbi:MAG: CRTAC1 family protein [Fuerstiella sp.]
MKFVFGRFFSSVLVVLCKALVLTLSLTLSGCGKPESVPKDVPMQIQRRPAIDSSEASSIRPSGTIPNFAMVGPESGFRFVRFDDISKRRRILEVNGGGVAVIDFDEDGIEDIFMPNGCRLPLSADDHATPGELFRNLGSMKFVPVSESSRLRQYGFGCGAAVGDWDADGFDDLYITGFRDNQFWRNNGDGTFTELAAAVGVVVPEWSSSAAFADINGDGWLDLYVVNYLKESDTHPTLCPNPASPDGYEGCSPAIFDGLTDRLFVSDGTWRAVDVTATSGLAQLTGKGLGVAMADLDADGTAEIYVANDGQENFLFVVSSGHTDGPNGSSTVTLKELAFEASVALNETGYAQAGMGIAAADYDRSGTVDLFLTHFYGDTNTLYANRGELFFEDMTRASGLGPPSRGVLGFGVDFIDIDNNGWSDLVVANGHVDNREWMPGGQPWKMPPQCYRNQADGSFTDVSEFCGSYFERSWLGRGLAVADLDADGRSDFVVSHQLDESLILRNQTVTENRSIDIRLVGTDSNRNGIGTRVVVTGEVPVLSRQLIGGGSFQSAGTQRLLLGLGTREAVDLEVHWPSGQVEQITNASPGRWVMVEGRSQLDPDPDP